MEKIEKELKDKLWNKLWKLSKPAKDYPEDWLVIPVLEVIELFEEDLKEAEKC